MYFYFSIYIGRKIHFVYDDIEDTFTIHDVYGYENVTIIYNNISFDNCDIIAYTCNAYSASGEETLGFNISDAIFNNCRINVIDINNLYIGTGIYHKPYSITFNNCVFDKNGNTSINT